MLVSGSRGTPGLRGSQEIKERRQSSGSRGSTPNRLLRLLLLLRSREPEVDLQVSANQGESLWSILCFRIASSLVYLYRPRSRQEEGLVRGSITWPGF